MKSWSGKARVLFGRGRLWYNKQQAWIQISLLPLAITIMGFLASRSVNLEKPSIVTALSFAGYLFFVFLSAVMSYANALRLKVTDAQNRSLVTTLSNIDMSVEKKSEKLGELVSMPQGESTSTELLGQAKRMLSFENSVSLLTQCLYSTVFDYLDRTDRIGGNHVHMVLLVPDQKTKLLRVIGQPKHNNGVRIVGDPTEIRVDDQTTMAGKLWSSKSSKVMCSNNTQNAVADGEFRFFDESEKRLIKSIFIYRIDSAVTGKPFGFWSIDSNSYDVLPNKREENTIGELTRIFNCFGKRVGLELAYKDLFEIADEAVDQLSSDNEESFLLETDDN